MEVRTKRLYSCCRNGESGKLRTVSRNLLLWKWSPEFDTSAKRKKARLKFSDITAEFAASGHHPAIGDADIAAFRAALDAVFGTDDLAPPLAVEYAPRWDRKRPGTMHG